MQIRPGHSQAKFTDRCLTDVDRSILEELGDYDVHHMRSNTPMCVIFDREPEKTDEFDVNFDTFVLTMYWLKASDPGIMCHDEIRYCQSKYRIKNTPVDLYDGWMRAELKSCEKC